MIPFLNLEPILQAPAGHPVTEAEAIQLIWGAVNSNFRGFRGIPALCCQVVGRKGICLEQGGCQRGAPCLLLKVKMCWGNAGFPYFSRDSQIIDKLANLKQTFDKKRRNTKLKEDQKQQYREKLKNTTFNIAPMDWETRILQETFLSGATNRERIRVLKDYIGEEATR